MLEFNEPIELMGVPGSPYTRKMLALLRYRRLQYRLLPASRHKLNPDNERYPQRPEPKVQLLPTFYLVDKSGEGQAVCDTTPIIRQLEQMRSARSVIPKNPILALINYIIEDYGDEWLAKAMFHYRWSYKADIQKAGELLPRWSNISEDSAALSERIQAIRELQISRLRYVGSNEVTKDSIENSFKRFIDKLDKHLNKMGFILGKRPSSCDFAIYGQLTCLALFDPTPQQHILDNAPRVYAWVEIMEDLSGYECLPGDWLSPWRLPDTLMELLTEIGSIYAPYLIANSNAYAKGLKEFESDIAGSRWKQATFPYQVRCLQGIREKYSKLDPEQAEEADEIFSGTGISALFKQNN